MQVFRITKGKTSVILPISIYDSSSTTGAKLAGLVFNTASLTAYYNRSGAAGAAVAITLATATKGTWATGGFIAIDGTNMPGDYELHIPDAALATGADTVMVQLKGAANMVPKNIQIELTAVDMQNATTAGLTNLDAAITSRMATYTQPTGFLAATFPTGTVANTTNITAGTITTTTNLTNLPAITANWITAAGISASALNGKGDWNIGKTGYSLTQAFPTNFSAMSLTAGGLVTLAGVTHTGAVIPTVSAVSGSVGSVTGAVGSVTGAVGSVTGAVGSVTGLTASNLDAAISSRATPAQILTTALTESYAADGAAPTLSQSLFHILGREYEFAISGDTLTVKRLDGITSAMTFTLAPAGGPYTSITRAT